MKEKTSTRRSRSRGNGQRNSSTVCWPVSPGASADAPDPLLLAVWERDREIARLKAELDQLRSQIWRSSMEMLDYLGICELAVSQEKVRSWSEMRRLISRLKGVL